METDGGCEFDWYDTMFNHFGECSTCTGAGPFLLVREFLRRLRKPRRKFAPDLSKVAIVVIGSTSGEFGEAGHVGKPRSTYKGYRYLIIQEIHNKH